MAPHGENRRGFFLTAEFLTNDYADFADSSV